MSSSNVSASFPKLELTIERSEQLVRLITDGLVNIVDETGEWLVQLPDGSKIDAKGWKGWEWTQGVALTILYNHSVLNPSSPSSQHSCDVSMDWFKLQYRLTGGKGAPKNINTMAPLYCLASLVQDGRANDTDGRWKAWCEDWADYIMKDLPKTQDDGFQHITYIKVNKDQIWDDTAFMTLIPLARLGVLLNRPDYIDEVTYQFLCLSQYLMDPTTGFWYHGWEFTGTGGHNFGRARWARGNCWLTYAIPLFFEIIGDHLKPSDPARRRILAIYRRQVNALLEAQDKATGLWHTLLDDPGSYLEVSASAGFAAGIFSGVRMGLLESDKYLPCAEAALAGTVANILPSGEVDNVSYGTPMGDDLDFYRKIPITPMPYGQALAMGALVEWERLQAATVKK